MYLEDNTKHSLELSFSKPQLEFLNLKTKVVCFLGGFGSGKTFANVNLALQNRLKFPHSHYSVYFFEPTHKMLSEVAYKVFAKVLELYGLVENKHFRWYGNPRILNIKGYGDIVFMSLDDPSKIAGFEAISLHIDEVDRIPYKIIRPAFDQLFGRLRLDNEMSDIVKGNIPRIAFSSTPEGFGFLYEIFEKEKNKERSLVRSSIYENKWIDVDDFLSGLEGYTEEQKRAYVFGEFVNFTTGCVYREFSEKNIDIVSPPPPGTRIFGGCDFNVGNCAVVLSYKEGDVLKIFDAKVKLKDTRDIIDYLNRHPLVSKSTFTMHPDASGRNMHTSSEHSDVGLLQKAGFRCIFRHSGNPAVKDTINLANYLFEQNRIIVGRNVDALIDPLRQQTYTEKGEPDKNPTLGIDHVLDAFRYNSWYTMSNSSKIAVGYRY